MPWEALVKCASALRARLNGLELQSFVKTSCGNQPGAAIANVGVMQGFPNYFMKVGPQGEVFDTGVPIVLGE